MPMNLSTVASTCSEITVILAALAMLIWKRKEENKVEETDEENMEDFAE